MKKAAFPIIMILALLITLTACGGGTASVKTMEVAPAKFSKETKEVLDLFENEITFLDYKVDETVKSILIQIWTYENGEWKQGPAAYDDVHSKQGRLALNITEYEYNIHWMKDSGHSKIGCPASVDFKGLSTASGFLDDTNKIELNKEIILWSCIGSGGNNELYLIKDNFRENTGDYDAGIVATILFSDKSADELTITE